MKALAAPNSSKPADPSELGFPPTLPLELALKEKSPQALCEHYKLSKADWDKLRATPSFVTAVSGYVEELKKDGMGFRLKARLQAEILLSTSFKLIHSSNDDVSPAVKADLIKSTIKWAGLSEEKKENLAPQNALQININLG